MVVIGFLVLVVGMQARPFETRYVAAVEAAGARWFCSDQYRDEWSPNLCYAETFCALYEAEAVARRHQGQVLVWRDAVAVASVHAAAP